MRYLILLGPVLFVVVACAGLIIFVPSDGPDGEDLGAVPTVELIDRLGRGDPENMTREARKDRARIHRELKRRGVFGGR
jgi:hypothetical protein